MISEETKAYYDLKKRNDVRESAKRIRRQFLRYKDAEIINFMLRSDDEQFSIISTFASWLKISPMKLQFKSITRRADSDKHVAMVREELEVEPSEECKHLGEDYINLIKDVGSREALTRRFFLIFQYEEIRRNETDDFAQIYSMMQTAEQNARAYFMQCGNNILQPDDPDEATAEILYMFFNRRSCIDEPFSSRVERVVVDTMAAKNKIIGVDEVPHIRFAHFIAPRGIDLKHHNYVIMDGLYYTFLYIKGDGYPSRVRAGWMSALINAGEGVDIDVHLRRENRSKTIDKVAQRIRLNRTKIKVDEDGKVIKGAVFGLFSNDENEYTRENAYMVTESAEDGTFKFENIPYGTWVVREIQPAVGFVLNEKAYQITIKEDGDVVEIKLENRYIRGDIEGLKLDEDGNVIAGAKFGLFKPGTTEFTEETAVLVTESDSEGKFRFEDIRFGKWIVRELVPATGYVLNETPIEVNIQTEGEIINISFENKFIRSDIKGYKVDEDGRDRRKFCVIDKV